MPQFALLMSHFMTVKLGVVSGMIFGISWFSGAHRITTSLSLLLPIAMAVLILWNAIRLPVQGILDQMNHVHQFGYMPQCHSTS